MLSLNLPDKLELKITSLRGNAKFGIYYLVKIGINFQIDHQGSRAS